MIDKAETPIFKHREFCGLAFRRIDKFDKRPIRQAPRDRRGRLSSVLLFRHVLASVLATAMAVKTGDRAALARFTPYPVTNPARTVDWYAYAT